MTWITHFVAFLVVFSPLTYGNHMSLKYFLSTYQMLDEEIEDFTHSFMPREECRSHLIHLNDSCYHHACNVLMNVTVYSEDMISLYIGHADHLYYVLFFSNGTALEEKCDTGIHISGQSDNRELTTLYCYLSMYFELRGFTFEFIDEVRVGICSNTLQEMSEICHSDNCCYTTRFVVDSSETTFTLRIMDYEYGISYYSFGEKHFCDVNQECTGPVDCPMSVENSVTCADVSTTMDTINCELYGSTNTDEKRGVLEIIGFIALGLVLGFMIATAMFCVIRRVQIKNLSPKSSVDRKVEPKDLDITTSSAVHAALNNTSDEPEISIKSFHIHPVRGYDTATTRRYELPIFDGTPDDIYTCIQDLSQYPDDAQAGGDNSFENSQSDHLNEEYASKKTYDNQANIYLDLYDDPDNGPSQRSDPYNHLPGVRNKIRFPLSTTPPLMNAWENADSQRRKHQYYKLEKGERRQNKPTELHSIDTEDKDSKKDYYILDKPS